MPIKLLLLLVPRGRFHGGLGPAFCALPQLMTATPRVEGWEQLTLRLSGLGSSCVAQARLLIIN